MDTTTKFSDAKSPMTPTEVGVLVKRYREVMQWSQETLAELCGLTVRTIQRVEAGQPSSLESRRALARGFQIPDLDAFSKPNPFPTPEELVRQKAEFDREYLVLDAHVVDGRGIMAMLIEMRGFGAIGPGSIVELPSAAQDAFTTIIDYVRDCMDVAGSAPQREMLDYGDEVDGHIADLSTGGYCLCMAMRRTKIMNKAWVNPTPMEIVIMYLVAAPVEAPAAKISVPRKLGSVGF